MKVCVREGGMKVCVREGGMKDCLREGGMKDCVREGGMKDLFERVVYSKGLCERGLWIENGCLKYVCVA